MSVIYGTMFMTMTLNRTNSFMTDMTYMVFFVIILICLI